MKQPEDTPEARPRTPRDLPGWGGWLGGGVAMASGLGLVASHPPWGAAFLGLGLVTFAWARQRQTSFRALPWFQEAKDELETADGTVNVPVVGLRGGKFRMGSLGYDNEKPVHTVKLLPFTVMQVPVTRTLFRQVMGEDAGGASSVDAPVTHVTWYHAIEFCNRMSRQAGLRACYQKDGNRIQWIPEADGWRLPTEAEWEFAIRAGTKSRYFFGHNDAEATTYAWFDACSVNEPQAVGQKAPNPWRLYDMAGNVLEWCWDAYGEYGKHHAARMKEDRFWWAYDEERVIRGGAFFNSSDWLRSAARRGCPPSNRIGDLGFRCVRGAFVD